MGKATSCNDYCTVGTEVNVKVIDWSVTGYPIGPQPMMGERLAEMHRSLSPMQPQQVNTVMSCLWTKAYFCLCNENGAQLPQPRVGVFENARWPYITYCLHNALCADARPTNGNGLAWLGFSAGSCHFWSSRLPAWLQQAGPWKQTGLPKQVRVLESI